MGVTAEDNHKTTLRLGNLLRQIQTTRRVRPIKKPSCALGLPCPLALAVGNFAAHPGKVPRCKKTLISPNGYTQSHSASRTAGQHRASCRCSYHRCRQCYSQTAAGSSAAAGVTASTTAGTIQQQLLLLLLPPPLSSRHRVRAPPFVLGGGTVCARTVPRSSPCCHTVGGRGPPHLCVCGGEGGEEV